MSQRSAHAPAALRSIAVIVTVAFLVVGGVIVGQRLLTGADARAPEAPLGPVSLTFGTFLGGLEWDEAFDVEVDDAGNRYVAGFTVSRDFPDARAEGPGGIVDAFVAKISADGALAWSVVLGGTDLDTATALALDKDGNTYVTGRTGSADFPTTSALQPEINGTACNGEPCHDAYVTKLN